MIVYAVLYYQLSIVDYIIVFFAKLYVYGSTELYDKRTNLTEIDFRRS